MLSSISFSVLLGVVFTHDLFLLFLLYYYFDILNCDFKAVAFFYLKIINYLLGYCNAYWFPFFAALALNGTGTSNLNHRVIQRIYLNIRARAIAKLIEQRNIFKHM